MDEMCGRGVCGGGGLLVLLMVGYGLMNVLENWGKGKERTQWQPKLAPVRTHAWFSGGSLLTVVMGLALLVLFGLLTYSGHKEAKQAEARQAAELWIADCEAKHPPKARSNAQPVPAGPASDYFAALPTNLGEQVSQWDEDKARAFLEGRGPRPGLSCAQVKQVAAKLYP